jgi:hypothetical protein
MIFFQEEIGCLEQILLKRTKELEQLETQIKHDKKELGQIGDSKFKVQFLFFSFH